MAYRMYTYFSLYPSSTPSSDLSHTLSFSQCLAFKVKTFQPNYKTNPFERRCFDVYAFIFLLLSFWRAVPSLLFALKDTAQSKTSKLKPIACRSENHSKSNVSFFAFLSYRRIVSTKLFLSLKHTLTSSPSKEEMYFLLGWMCICLWNFQHIVVSRYTIRILSNQLLQKCKIWLGNKITEKNATPHCMPTKKVDVEHRLHWGRNRHKKRINERKKQMKFHANFIQIR